MTGLALEHSDITNISTLVTRNTGIKLTADHQSMMVSACKTLMLETGTSLSQLLQRLNDDAVLLDRLLSLVTIPESYFFRDPPHFSYIRESVIPQIDQLRGPGHIFRVWSAGCAGGEEAYSLAMLFEEAGIAPQDVKLLACDISRRALSRARKGVYTSWSMRGERAMALPESFLRRTSKHFEVAERFRKQVNFFYLNLAGNGYPSVDTGVTSLDLILCRNVLIYLDAVTIRHVAQRLYDSLAPGGYLIPGPSDPLLSGLAPFEAQLTPGGLVYRKPCSSGLYRQERQAQERQTQVRLTEAQFQQPKKVVEPKEIQHYARRAKVNREPLKPTEVKPRAIRARAPVQADRVSQAIVIDKNAATNDTDLKAALYAQTLLFMQQSNDEQALALLKKLLYLDPTLAVAHFASGLLYSRQANSSDAVRAYRNAIRHASALPSQQPLALTDGEPAGLLVAAAQQQINVLHNKFGDGQ